MLVGLCIPLEFNRNSKSGDPVSLGGARLCFVDNGGDGDDDIVRTLYSKGTVVSVVRLTYVWPRTKMRGIKYRYALSLGVRSRVLVAPNHSMPCMESRGDIMSEGIRSDTVIATGRRGSCRLHQMRIPKMTNALSRFGSGMGSRPSTADFWPHDVPSRGGPSPRRWLAMPISNYSF